MTSLAQQTESNEDQLRNIISDMANMNGQKNPGREHMDQSCLFIRPSGNPLTMEGWDKMMNSDDVFMTDSSLVSVNKLEVDSNMAYACYTIHSKFNYKGTENDDIAVFTGVFQKKNDKWKLVHGQRSTGRPPDQDIPHF